MAVNAYTQDVVLDADGKPVLDALGVVQKVVDDIQRAVAGIGVRTVDDAKKWHTQLAQNLQLLKQAQSDLRTVQNSTRSGDSSGISAKVFYQEEQKLARENANVEKVLAKEVADYEKAQDREAIASAKEVAAARKEAATAAVTARARGITNRDDATAAKAASDQRLAQLRSEREATATSDREASRGLANRIDVEKALNKELDSTIRKLGQQAEAERKASAAATARLEGARAIGAKTLAPTMTGRSVDAIGSEATLAAYKEEQALATSIYAAVRRNTGATEEQLTQARRRLELANANVAAIDRIVAAEEREVEVQRQLNLAAEKGDQRAGMALAQPYARSQVDSLGVDVARAEAKTRIAAAEAKVATTTGETRTAALGELEIERARLRAIEQIGKEQAIQQRQSLGGRASTALQNTALYGAVAGIGYGALAAAGGALSNIVQLEDELAKLQAISNSTDSQMQTLKGTIFGIGDSSRFAVDDLVKIAQTLAQAGVSASEMGDVLKSVATLATASGSSPEEAVNLVTSAIGAFQLQASEAGRIADLMTTALNRTKLTVTQVGQAIQYVGATAYENNISLEQLLATIGAVAQGGVKSGSTIGTGFRQFLVDLQNPSEKLNFQLQRLGITQADVDVKTRGLSAVIDTLKEKGFGASQAYGALENRSAAFYLVAKNNTDVMDQLQISFAQQGATALANERAMNSLTAQWQRFKNILTDVGSNSSNPLIALMQDALKASSDLLQAINDYQKLKAGQQQKTLGQESVTIGGSTAAAAGVGAGIGAGIGVFAGGVGAAPGALAGAGVGATVGFFGSIFEELKNRAGGAKDSVEKLNASFEAFGTQIADANEKVQKHQDTLTEVDKEMGRLRLQQNDLIGNQQRSQAETITLTSRFEGLVRYLGTTKNAYLDLIHAMNQYRGEESRLLSQASFGALAEQQNQNAADTNSLGKLIARIRGDSGLNGNLSASQRQFLNDPNAANRIAANDPNDMQARNFAAAMTAAATRVQSANAGLAKALNDAAMVAGRLTVGTISAARTKEQAYQAAAAGTGIGVRITGALSNDQSDLDRIRDRPEAERAKLGGTLMNSVKKQIAEIGALKPVNADMRKFLQGSIDTLNALLLQIAAAIKPTANEIKEAARKAAEQKKEQSAAHQRPFVTENDLNSVLTSMGLAGRFGRGHDESDAARADEDRMHARGQTRATADTSDHTRKGGVARDISIRGMSDEEAKNLVTAINVQLKAAGIDGTAKFETGKGANQGTARHIHVGIRPYTRFTKDREAAAANAIDRAQADTSVKTDTAEFEQDLKELTGATTQQAFDAAAAKAKAAVAKLGDDLKTQAAAKLASEGVVAGSAAYKDRMAEIDLQIATNVAKLNEAVAAGLIKSIEAQVKAAEASFKRAIQPATDALAFSQGQLQGLDLYSNRNKVPDYTKQLASDRVAQNQETLDRVTAAALPARITAQQAALARAQGVMATIQSNAAASGGIAEADPAFGNVSGEIDKLTQSLADLQKQKQSLDATLNGGSLLPTTLNQGLQDAIQAYRQANALNNTFSQDLIMNLGGALTQVHTGLTTMFTSIMDGSQTALQAFGNFAKGIMQYMIQLAAKAVATQVFNLLLNVVSGAIGGKSSTPGQDAAFIRTNTAAGITTAFHGGRMGDAPGTIYRAAGGSVENGNTAADSVNAKLARGEWVMQKSAVDSVGNQFMARLNQHGAKALDGLQAMPKLDMRNHTETNVYVVPPEQKPQIGPGDVRVILNDELMYGEGKRLVQHISRDS